MTHKPAVLQGVRGVGRFASLGTVCVALVAAASASAAPPAPGALPTGFRYVYNDGFRGWPVAPLHREHPVRGGFLDPRRGGYHFGIDISVDDASPERGAPRGMSHRVYAIESGYARVHRDESAQACHNRRLEIGHFAYWHVAPTVRPWQWVAAGQSIGWTCRGLWHVHLSEWQRLAGKVVWVNPLHNGGKLTPYVNTTQPAIGEVRFVADSGARFKTTRLRGRVEVLARVEDAESYRGFLARDRRLSLPEPPYQLSIMIRSAPGAVVISRTAFRADRLPLETPFRVFFAPPTLVDLSLGRCMLAPRDHPCVARHWFRPLSRTRREFWDTRKVANGRYAVTVTALDVLGNAGQRTVDVVVANGAHGAER